VNLAKGDLSVPTNPRRDRTLSFVSVVRGQGPSNTYGLNRAIHAPEPHITITNQPSLAPITQAAATPADRRRAGVDNRCCAERDAGSGVVDV
jgi:hypothetical protein